MGTDLYRIYDRIVAWTLAAAALVYCLWRVVREPMPLIENPAALVLLTILASAAAITSTRRGRVRGIRLAPAFALAAIASPLAQGGLLVGLVAAAVGRGAGLTGLRRGGPAAFAAAAVALALAEFFRAGRGEPDSLVALAHLALLYVLIQGLSLAIGLPLAPEESSENRWRGVAWEALNIPLAWLIADVLSRGNYVAAVGLGVCATLASYAGVQHARTVGKLSRTHDSLTERFTELATLHAIGREILSTMEPARVFAILDRECRKIFDIDFSFVGLAGHDGAPLCTVYTHRSGRRPETLERPLSRGAAAWVMAEKRAIKIDDVQQLPAGSPYRGDLIEKQTRSLIAAPLIVEQRVIGVICLQSKKPQAYDEHQLSLLTTIAQQAAIVIENARHYQLATIDSLTGFFVRDHFFQRLNEEFRRVKRYGGNFAVLMVDLDDFKRINDENGHLAGDCYLREIATAIRKELREADLACRYGGDEFCLLLPETDLSGARVIAERVRQAVARRLVGVDGSVLRSTASIGYAVFPDHPSADARELMRNADTALYSAKRAGRDRVASFAA